MADVKTEQEPSIEEILESIRQIISEDAEEEKQPVAEVKPELPKEPVIAPPNLSLAPKAEAPVPPSSLSLAQAPAAAPAPPPPPPPKPAKPVDSKPASPPPLDLTEKITPEPASSSPPTIEMMDSPMTDKDKSSGDKASSLMSPETAATVTDLLSKILASNIALENEGNSPAGKVTLEEITRELMKPIIKSWIDQHLPGIIDKAVQKEVEKLSRRAMDR